MIGALMAGVSVARKAATVKRAVGEVQDVMKALDELSSTYKRIASDGKITQKEAQELVRKVAEIVEEGNEARRILGKVF